MTFCSAPVQLPTPAEARSSMRRGACPSLATPMVTGDGLLVRLRPVLAGVSTDALIAIADAAGLCGNGILEITARGNLQVRGLKADTVPLLASMISEAGVEMTEGLAIETPPLAGFDPTELVDPSFLAGRLRAAVQARLPTLQLAPKLSVVIDGGGRFHLGGVTADIRLKAINGDCGIVWSLGIAGTDQTALTIASLEEKAVVPAVMLILETLSSIGSMARARDLDAQVLKRQIVSVSPIDDIPIMPPAANPAGIHDFGDDRIVLGVGLAFGQIRADGLRTFLEGLSVLGVKHVRLAPGHAMMVPGIPRDRIAAAQALALGHGLRAFPEDPRNHIAACAGIGACASAGIDTRSVAQMLVETAPSLLDGSMTVHVSGCGKGCAKPSASPLTITSAPIGYGLVVNGTASGEPDADFDKNSIRAAIECLDGLVRDRKRAGESAGSCLTRVGARAIAIAVQQG